MTRVRYIGHKDRKEDNVGKSGAVWFGHGDIQEVPARAWGALSRHPDVWELADGAASVQTIEPESEDDDVNPPTLANMSLQNPDDQDDEASNVVARPGAIPTPPGVPRQGKAAGKAKKA